ncbi:uncharacterized protein LOC130730188 [Lotus japonicus]|uniref:uncharacterized protein LOC130730188 n=1 Tax=Lotus japonicus TaxID=34305 RepID=UPI00258F6E01|nr:uncharacterized protein LOC130730188 [Lotus japonicus]
MNFSSARVPTPSVAHAPSSTKQGGAVGDDSSLLEVSLAEDDEADGKDGEESKRSESIFVGSYTLFVDGISEAVGYPQIRALFARIGRLGKVFVRRHRKIGRRFRFGFVHFLSRIHAEMAVAQLNGTKVGGSHLSVTVAKFPLAIISTLQHNGSKALVSSQSGTLSCSQKVRVKGFGTCLLSGSWRDVVLGNLGVRRRRVLSVAEDCMFLASWRGCDEVDRLPVEFLFPELASDRWSVGAQLEENEAIRMPVDLLFPEWRFGANNLDGGEGLSEQDAKVHCQDVGSDFAIVTELLPSSSSLAGLNFLDAAKVSESPCEVDGLVSVDSAVGSSGMPRRRGRPKKARDGATTCALVVDPGEGTSKGRCPLENDSRPRGRPRKGVSSSMVLVHVRSSSPSSGEVVLYSSEKQLVVFDSQRVKGTLGVMTRARAALALGVRLGLSYYCSDEEEALQGTQLILALVGLFSGD